MPMCRCKRTRGQTVTLRTGQGGGGSMRGALQAGASPGPRPQLLGPPRRCPTPPHCCSLSPVPVSRPGPRWLQALPSQGALGQHPSWAVPWLRWLCPGHFFLRALPGSDRGQDEGRGPAEGTCVSKTEGEEGKRGNRAPGAGVEDKPVGGSAGRVLAMQSVLQPHLSQV